MASPLKREHGLLAEINVTSLVDVTIVLLIMFMIIAPISQGGIEVRVPQTESAALPSSEAILISVDAEGRVYIDRPVSNSGRLAEIIRTTAAAKESSLEAMTADRVDEILKTSTAVVATADSAILDRCGAWVNLARLAIEGHRAELDPLWLLDLSP